MLRLLAAAFLLVSADCGARAAAGAPAAPSADALARTFGARPNVNYVALAPDGHALAYQTPMDGDRSAVVVLDIDKGTTKAITSDRGNQFHLSGCRWKTNTRLICTLRASASPVGKLLLGFTRSVAVDRDGSNAVVLAPNLQGQSTGDVIDMLPDDPEHVLMAVRGMTAKLNIDTGTFDRKYAGDGPFAMILTDGRGRVRLHGVQDFSGVGARQHRVNLVVEPKAGSRPTFLTGVDYLRMDIDPMAFDESGEWLYALAPNNGRKALVRFATDGSRRSEPVFASDKVDIDGLLQIGKYRRPVAAAYTLEAPTFEYFDPALKRLATGLTRALGGGASVAVLDESWDGTRKLAAIIGNNAPERYFVYDTARKEARELLTARPEVAGMKLAAITPVTYPAADGTTIPAYLTLPPGRSANAPGPAILMPHGGPGARDAMGYDWLAQYFAAIGYAVLQPNFRGSTGYGDAWFEKNGFQSWPVAMGDINDGARWLIASGTADPKRLAIFGWSYGGYAALQANVVDPALYRAAVAVAPVTDLQLLRDQSRKFDDGSLTRDFIGQGAHVYAGSPARNAARIAAPVLIFQGDKDLNVDIAQARKMDSALAAAGKRHELVIYPGLNHQLDDSTAREDMLRRSAEFLAANMGAPTGVALSTPH